MTTPYLTAQEHRSFGQRYHGAGFFPDALEHFGMGYELAAGEADELQAAALARGAGTAAFRMGEATVSEDWMATAERHGFTALNTAQTDQARHEAFRERIIHGITVGRFGLIKALTAELAGDTGSKELGSEAKRRLWLARIALPEVETDGQPDQYRISGIPVMSIGETMFGSRKTGLWLAAQAPGLAIKTESPTLPTRSDLGSRNRFNALKRSTARAAAANVVAWTPQTEKGRRFAAQVSLKVL